MRYHPAKSHIVVGHSHFFRCLIGEFTIEEFRKRNPSLTSKLKTSKLDHCAPAAVVLDFGEDEADLPKIEEFRSKYMYQLTMYVQPYAHV